MHLSFALPLPQELFELVRAGRKDEADGEWADVLPSLPPATQFAYRLTVSRKRLVNFTSHEGAQYHCGPMAPQRRNQVFFDWLGSVVP